MNTTQSEPQPLLDSIGEWVKSAAIGVVMFFVIRTLFLQTFTIISGSMEGTLLVGDFLVLNKAAYGATIPGTDVRLPGYDEPRRGDVVVFDGVAERIDVVKRLVGLPGDTVAMEDGQLYVNGRVVAEPYVRRLDPGSEVIDPEMRWQFDHLIAPATARELPPTTENWGPLLVPADHYFMLGDNRDYSRDSRYWGFVPHSHLKGRAAVLYFSWGAGVRWDRIGDLIR